VKSVEVHEKPREENDAAQEQHQMSQEEHSTSLECHTPYETLDETCETTGDGCEIIITHDGCETTGDGCEINDFEKTVEDESNNYETAFEVGMHTNPIFSLQLTQPSTRTVFWSLSFPALLPWLASLCLRWGTVGWFESRT